MADERRDFPDVSDYWDGLVRGERAEPGNLDPVLVETVRRLQSLASAPLSASARERARARVLATAASTDVREHAGNEVAAMQPRQPFPHPNGLPDPRSWRTSLPSPPVSKRRRRWAMAQFATAILLLVTLLAIYEAFFRSADQRAVAPIGGTPTVIAAPVVPSNVPTFRGDFSRTGINPGPGPQGKPVVRWKVDAPYMFWCGAAVVDGVVYVNGNGGAFLALDASTGSERWRLDRNSFSHASPTVVDGVVFAGFEDGMLLALDAATGAERWELSTGAGIASTPAVVDGVVYVDTGILGAPGDLVAVEAATGHERWRLHLDSSGFASPAVVDGVVYVGTGEPSTHGGAVYAVDAATGAQRWTFPTGYDFGDVAVVGGSVYVDSDLGVFALDAATGAQRWSFATESGAGFYTAPAVAGGTVYAANQPGGYLVALDAASGAERWRAALGSSGNSDSSPTVADGVVYVASDGAVLHAIDAATGAERWQLTLPTPEVWASPTVVDGIIYLGTDSAFYALGDPLPATPPA